MSGVTSFRTLILLACCLAPVAAQAAIINLYTSLDGSQEVPTNATLGTGTATVTFDDVSNLLGWNISFSGLTGAATGAHFHGPAAVGVNAGVQVNIGAISGLTSPMIGSTTITGSQATDLLAGLWYINIHTATFPGGEIRGQVQQQVVPVPAAFWLLSSGLAALLGWRRPRRA
ncbi:MAG: CHRD domain-containing protein [Gammaproteobacteria bacterium]|nr:CHRD domain-containing protein [Gammaproteobacteria bacterium]